MKNENERMKYYSIGKVRDKSITKVIILPGVEKIDDYAFRGCLELVYVFIPDSVRYIGQGAFFGCRSLQSVGIPDGVTVVKDQVFLGCEALENIYLPHTTTAIGDAAFEGCSALRRITLPQGLIKIGAWAFSRCGLETIVIPSRSETIHSWAFHNCLELHTVELPPSLREIGSKVFCHCMNLEHFMIPNGLALLKELNLHGYTFEQQGWQAMSHLIANAHSLEKLVISSVSFQQGSTAINLLDRKIRLSDGEIPMILGMVQSCPTLKCLDISENDFTHQVFQVLLASQSVPEYLRHLRINCIRTTEKKEAVSTTGYLFRFLEQNPKLAVWTNRFWDDDSEKQAYIRHILEMNQYGCRGFPMQDAIWPPIIQRLYELDETNILVTGAPNILYHMLQRYPEVLVRSRQKTTYFSC